ncbi:MAG: formylglycine-generating enzyme family protein [Burkholderiales bacterium]
MGAKIDDEINDKPTPTTAFFIARYPVTVAQFRAFVSATYVALDDPDALSDPDTRPVCSVSWHEALGYCDWLTQQFRGSPVLATSEIARLVREDDWCVALPSELEWERAARGDRPNAVFSWGDEPDPERANYAVTNINTTSAVGCFPANSLGLHDMIGNVWEWTRSQYKPYPYRTEDGREDLSAGDDVRRVVRGGSFDFDPENARCAFRLRLLPDGHYDPVGFRVVLRGAPVR